MINPETLERVERALELLADGMPLRRAAEASGTTLRTVVRVCEEEGIPLRQDGRRYILDNQHERSEEEHPRGALLGGLGILAAAVVGAALRRRMRRDGTGGPA